ncbi:DNA (cytosine-5)-methyltransferase 1-like [Haemaphysalis longicornis]
MGRTLATRSPRPKKAKSTPGPKARPQLNDRAQQNLDGFLVQNGSAGPSSAPASGDCVDMPVQLAVDTLAAGTTSKKAAAVRKPARDCDDVPPAKKEKKRRSSSSAVQPKVNGNNAVHKKVAWCKDCRKRLNSPEIVFFKGDCEGAVPECVAIIDPQLTSSLSSRDDLTAQPLFKLTEFTIYDEHDHLCAFDGGLIEADVPLYFSGHVKSVCAEDPGIEDSVSVARGGAVVAWWTSGYDGGSMVVLGITTELAEYVLMAPSTQYEPYVRRIHEKSYLIKGVLEKLVENGGSASFDDVVGHLESLSDHPKGVAPFSLETLHKHAQFVVDHVQAYDAAGNADDERPLLESSFISELMRVTGAIVRDTCKGQMLPSKLPKKPFNKLESRTVFVMPAIDKTVAELFEGSTIPARSSGAPRSDRCGLCEACLASECKVCIFCRNMKKYGGTGTKKQCCIRRRCQQRRPRGNDEHLGGDAMDHEVAKLPLKPFEERVFPVTTDNGCAWIGEPFVRTQAKSFLSADLKNCSVTVGQDVLVMSLLHKTEPYVGRVTELVENPGGEKLAHVIWFRRYEETVLGSAFLGDGDEVFLTTECDLVPLAIVVDTCRVAFRGPGAGTIPNDTDKKSFYYSFSCDATTCTFTALESESVTCLCSKVKNGAARNGAKISLKADDCVFVRPDIFPEPPKHVMGSVISDFSDKDDDVFSERYRRDICPPKIDCPGLPLPYVICRILSSTTQKNQSGPDSLVKVQRFFRDREVSGNSTEVLRLYLSTETSSIKATDIVGHCEVHYSAAGVVGNSFDTVRPPFYFSHCYDVDKGSFLPPPSDSKQVGRNLVSRVDTLPNTLMSADVYCGCGGLSFGLLVSGVAAPALAVSDNEHHLATFKQNFPSAATPHASPANVLKKLKAGGMVDDTFKGLRPQDIEIVCGSPSLVSSYNTLPLQRRDKQAFRNSQLVTFFGFCAFFDPSYVVLAVERRAVSYNKGAGFIFALKCLIELGYHTSCSVLQDGCYGMPQRHRRMIILGAKRGRAKLPSFPVPTHSFELPDRHLSFVIDGRAYSSPLNVTSAAPYCRTTLRDAIGDLQLGAAYTARLPDFAAYLKRYCEVDTDCYKKMTPLSQARIVAVPKEPGADWRDLPNREVELSDGTTAFRLIYTHECLAAVGTGNRQRGVCCCAENEKGQCDPLYRQENTLIPWSLVHTGHRSNQWSGVYGRLQWDGYLHGVVVNPEPLSKEGPVIHPEEDRVISVRECARIQGYPDDFVFVGPLMEQYKMIAVSVPPTLAMALGREIIKAQL